MLALDQFLPRAVGRATIYKSFRTAAERDLSTQFTVCIPDMHLLEKGPTDDFLDGKPEHERRFEEFLYYLLDLKNELGEEMGVVQLGDMFDLWQARGNTNLIHAAYPNILGLLDTLKPVYIVGNHDIDLLRYYQGQTFGRRWRHYAVTADSNVRTLFEHGFQADCFNNQASWSGAVGREVTVIAGLMEYIEPDMDIILGGMWDRISRFFSVYNAGLTPVTHPQGFNTHEYLSYYIDLMQKYNRGETDDHREPTDLALAVVGHTHTARLVSRPKEGRTYYLMDCGSWVNGGHEFRIIAGRVIAICQWM